ncbi:MAG: transposase [Candidatus Lokiarchaeota archaeon]|nr:transposase [Candidatus Lokiarchaeota archaeon]MBD3201173.1 transposase [Candidatus Lokiarchaeota archaeon]
MTNVGFHRVFRCPHCGLIYDRDLNASINIAQRIRVRWDGGRVNAPNSRTT